MVAKRGPERSISEFARAEAEVEDPPEEEAVNEREGDEEDDLSFRSTSAPPRGTAATGGTPRTLSFFGSTLSQDGHSGARFDYLIADPPYGKDWKRDREAVEVVPGGPS